MAIRGGYAPPGVYTESVFENPTPIAGVTGRIPLFIGTGADQISAKALFVVRGSSATIDQQIVEEDADGRVVTGVLPNGSYTLGSYNGVLRQIRTRLFPIVTGDGSGTTARNSSSISVTINGQNVVVVALDGAQGLLTLSQAPKANDDVRVTYFFKRTDTFISAEDASHQVSTSPSVLYGSSGSMAITSTTRTFLVTVDGSPYSVTLPIKSTDVAREDHLSAIVSKINSSALGSLVASSYTDQKGTLNLKLSASGSILIGSGAANDALGLIPNQTGSARNTSIYTAYSPIVDGSNAGRTTTEITDVRVLVDDVEAVISSVDGANGEIVLATPPKIGQTVKVSYHYNPFKDNFDYIPARNITSVDRVSLVPAGGGASSLFTEGVDWVLKNDKIYWGTFADVSVGGTQEGQIAFGPTQVSTTLKDEKIYNALCTPFTDTSVSPPRVLANKFVLPFQPTDGTGSAIPTSRTDLVKVRVGVSISDALSRPEVAVARVNPSDSTIVLTNPIPQGYSVYATFFYNNIQDQFVDANGGYTLTVRSVGASNIGTYNLSKGGVVQLAPKYTSKGSALTLTDIVFPSGTELISDVRLGSGLSVEEVVTLTIGSFEPTPAIFTSTLPSPYRFIDGESDDIELDVDNGFFKSKSVALSNPTGLGFEGFFTSLVSNPFAYLPETDSSTLGASITGDLFLKIDGASISISNTFLDATAADIADALNTASQSVPATYTAMTAMNALAIVAGSFDELSVRYVGNNTGAVTYTLTVTDQAYSSVNALASEVEDQLGALIAADLDPNRQDIVIGVTSDLNCLKFTLSTLATGDSYGYVEFVEQADPETDFALIAGIDVDSADGAQTKFGILPIAEAVSTDLSTENSALKDRLILRNRTLLGNNYYPSVDLGVEVVSGSLLTEFGLTAQSVVAQKKAVVSPATLLLRAGWSEQSETTSAPAVIFYDGTGDEAANNVLNLDISGNLYSVEFAASASGTTTDLFSDGLGVGGSVQGQLGAILLGGGYSVKVEGANLRVVSGTTDDDYIAVLEGSANSVLGISEGVVRTATLVGAEALVSALLASGEYFSSEGYLFEPIVANTSFRADAIAYVTANTIGQKYVTFESLTTGLSSILDFTGGNAITTVGTGFGVTTADGAVGEGSYQGFFVTSSNPKGSGSINTSRLNGGVGQDGVIGQTYIDSVTGLTFTILEREGGQTYPTGANATLTFKVSKTIFANANIPVSVIPGVQLTVANTVGTEIGDTAIVETYNKSGSEPSNGSEYYMDITRRKSSYATQVFTSISDVVAQFGDISPESPLSLAAYIAFQNGTGAIALKQIPLEAGQTEPTPAQFAVALSETEGQIADDLFPSVIVPLIPASSQLLLDLSSHCDLQSSIRYRAERTAIVGVAAGTIPQEAASLALGVRNARVRLVYPDIASISVTNLTGVSQTFIIDGRYLAVATACATTRSTVDAATPWTNTVVQGFGGLLRTLDAVDANKTANSGVTIIHQQAGEIKIRHGLTTDMSSILTQVPTVVQIADFVHVSARDLLNPFIGLKYLPSVTGQIEGRVNQLFKNLVSQQIIDSYANLSVTTDPSDPTSLLVNVYYKPVFPLLYIQFTFNITSAIATA
jgi:hypothetical protein